MKNKRTLIKNGQLHDGKHFIGIGDVLIEDDKLEQIGGGLESAQADQVIDAQDCVVAPGFVDAHNMMYQLEQLDGNDAINLIAQGVTSCVIGNCGNSGPIATDDQCVKNLELIRQARLKINIASLVGHNSLRRFVVSRTEAPSIPQEIERMSNILRQALEAGSKGFSSGLMYAPGMFAHRDELELLVRIVSEYDGVYTTHIRDEGDAIIQAVAEALDTAKAGQARLVISHHKVVGVRNQGKTRETITEIEKHQKSQDIKLTFYPYEATQTLLSAVLTDEIMRLAQSDLSKIEYRAEDNTQMEVLGKQIFCPHGWKDIVVTSSTMRGVVGQSIATIAQTRKPYEAVVEILQNDPQTRVIFHNIVSEPDLHYVSQFPYVMICTDGYLFNMNDDSPTHPRNYGSIARMIREYVNQRGLIKLEELIRRITSLPAETFHFNQRGLLQKGYFADVTVFNPQGVQDQSTYDNPHALATGVKAVLVNGESVYLDNQLQEVYPGKLI